MAAPIADLRHPPDHVPAVEVASQPLPVLEPPALSERTSTRVEGPPVVAAVEAPQLQISATHAEVAPAAVAPPPPEVVLRSVAEPPAASTESPDPDLLAVAHICTALARVQTMADVPLVLYHMTKVLDAIGLVLWMWDPIANELVPALAHGYSDRVVAQLPRVERDSNNATAAAFRAGETCIVSGDDIDNGALAVPLVGPGGCAGVLAIELAERREEKESVRAHSMIFAAQLATLLGMAQPAEASGRRFA